jgi:GNAT superfamily N-acetyltransferase
MAKSKSPARISLSFHPLTPARWGDFEQLFGSRGACGGCWCMYWRRPRPAFERGKGAGNRRAMKALVESGTEPGILAYTGKRAVGWCSVAPREEFIRLGSSRILKSVDDVPVWSVTCLFIDRDYRNRGVSVALLKAAIDFVAKRGGTVVEGYPVEPKTAALPPAFAWTGIAAAYLRAGFREHRRGSATRPIMRYEIASDVVIRAFPLPHYLTTSPPE